MRIEDGFLLWVLHDGVMVWRIIYVAHWFFIVVGYSCLPCNRFLLLGFDFHYNLCSITAMDRELCEVKKAYQSINRVYFQTKCEQSKQINIDQISLIIIMHGEGGADISTFHKRQF